MHPCSLHVTRCQLPGNIQPMYTDEPPALPTPRAACEQLSITAALAAYRADSGPLPRRGPSLSPSHRIFSTLSSLALPNDYSTKTSRLYSNLDPVLPAADDLALFFLGKRNEKNVAPKFLMPTTCICTDVSLPPLRSFGRNTYAPGKGPSPPLRYPSHSRRRACTLQRLPS